MVRVNATDGLTKSNMCDLNSSEILAEEIWKGRIQLELVVNEDDLTAPTKPAKCFISASRFSYLPAIAADAVHHLSYFAIEFNSEVWFESGGIPLKWCVFKSKLSRVFISYLMTFHGFFSVVVIYTLNYLVTYR